MRFTLPLLLLPIAVQAVSTPGNCTNGACKAVDEHAQRCAQAGGETTAGAYTTCLCIDYFTVNLDRCQRGYICPWNGTSDQTLSCVDQYCPGNFEDEPSLVLACNKGNVSASGTRTLLPTAVPGPNTIAQGSSTPSTTTTRASSTPTSSPTGGAVSLVVWTIVPWLTAFFWTAHQVL